MYKEEKTQRGITLIALVITIIVMLILVGVTISMAVNGGLFNYAGKATGETKNAINAEQELANGGIEVDGQWYNSIDEYLETKNGGEKVETISKTESYVGYYADVDGDGTVDGVIYADLLKPIENGNYYGYNYSYGEEVVSADEVKDYCVSGTYDGDFNEEGEPKEVLTPTGDGEDRFYVMALSDFTQEGNIYCWYYNAYDNEDTELVTEDGFGTGKTNTITMIEKWNESAFGTQNGDSLHKDVWGAIDEMSNEGWFIPSATEWFTFFGELDVSYTYDEYDNTIFDYSLSSSYWTSTQGPAFYEDWLTPGSACFISLESGFRAGGEYDEYATNLPRQIRLSTTF